ncbi:hypothetical protein LCGC14_1499440 [marine sediment metagenome]|uniref:Uncharacterized protein n=1 Tax=marine sediment metagenome TaxID=412755 RepID=A0A0F9JQC4_9ZZZZ|nr:hypothetical protein [Candidatus Scalindua sp.]
MSDLDTLSNALDEIGCKFIRYSGNKWDWETDEEDTNIREDHIYPCSTMGSGLGVFIFENGKFKEWEA